MLPLINIMWYFVPRFGSASAGRAPERYIYIYIYIYVFIYVYTCMYVCMYVYVHIYIYIYLCICSYICIYMCVCMYVCIYIYTHTCIYVYVYVYVYVCMYVYIYIYISIQRIGAWLGRGDDTVGKPDRTQFFQFELFELIFWSELVKQLPVEQFEATVSQSAVPSPPS